MGLDLIRRPILNINPSAIRLPTRPALGLETIIRVGDAPVVFLLKRIVRRPRHWIAPIPELFDEFLALVIRLQCRERLLFLRRDDVYHLFIEPFLIRRHDGFRRLRRGPCRQRDGERHRQDCRRNGWSHARPFAMIQQTSNAFHHTTSRGGQSRLLNPSLRQRRQCRRISMRVALRRHHQIVAAVLALRADDARNPPCSRMIKEQPFQERLQQVYQIVSAADMRQFVQKNGLHLIDRQPGEQSKRHQNHRLGVADHHRNVREAGFQQRDAAGHA